MAGYAELSQELMGLLRLRTVPVGITLFHRRSDIPEAFEMVHEECSVCQVIGLARYFEKAVAATKEELTACPVGCFSLGMCDLPDRLDESAGKWGKTPEAGLKQARDRMAIEKGRFEAIGVAPLGKMPVEPDIVQVWGWPYHMESLAYASVWDGGDKLELSTNGHGASCNEVLAVPYLTGKTRLAIADQGDRWHGFATEEEMILGCSLSELKRLIVNLRESMQNIYYPRNYNPLKLTYNPRYSARTYQGTL
jgi:uncharacterized protein (DUF169 family)